VEHAILHLLYARFMAKFLASCGQWPTNVAEPFKKLVTQGMVHGKTFSDPSSGRFLKPEEVEFSNEGNPKIKSTGETPNISFEKMSKSKYNGVDPAICMTKYGADVTRAHMLFAAPESEVLEWEEERISGVSRWLSKVWRVVHRANHVARPGQMRQAWERTNSDYSEAESDLLHTTRITLESVTKKLADAAGLNTVVSDLIKLTNSLINTVVPPQSSDCEVNTQHVDAHEVAPSILLFCTEALIRMLAPLTPAFAEESWNILHQDEKLHFSPETEEILANMSVFEHSWPNVAAFKDTDSSLKTQVCVLQVNGKRRFDCKIPVPREGLSQEEIEEWLIDYVFEQTPEGSKFMEHPNNKELLGKVERFVVGRKGAILNIVIAKEKKKANSS
jgi:leucyl-tRNA synthetase